MLVLFLAYFLEWRMRQMDDVKGTLLPVVIPIALMCGLVMKEPDLGTALVLRGGIGDDALHCGDEAEVFRIRVDPDHSADVLAVVSCRFPADADAGIFHPDRDPQGAGFHMMQSLIAVGTGGLLGAD